MKLVLVISLFATSLTLFGATDSAFLKKSDALEFLDKVRKHRDVDGGCAGGRCTSEEDNDVFDDASFGEEFLNFYLFRSLLQRLHYSGKYQTQFHPVTESPAEPTMMPQVLCCLAGSTACWIALALSGTQLREVVHEEGEFKAAVVYRLIRPGQRRAKMKYL